MYGALQQSECEHPTSVERPPQSWTSRPAFMSLGLRYDAILIAIPLGLLVLIGWTMSTPSRDLLTIAAVTLVLTGLVADALFRNPPD